MTAFERVDDIDQRLGAAQYVCGFLFSVDLTHYGCAIGEPMKAHTMTDEPVIVTDVRAGITPFTAVFNLPYLIPMAQIFLCQNEDLRPVVTS